MIVEGETVLITGGCGGIGLAMAGRFVGLGKKVILVDRNLDKGRDIADHADVRLVEIDFADEVEAERHLAGLVEEGVAPDILINNIGVSPKRDAAGNRLTAWTVSPEAWREIFAVNATSHFLCVRAFVPGMIDRRRGRVINIGSYAARTGGYQAASHYQATKAAVLGFTRALAREAAPYGITVNAINPGRIITPMTADVSPEVNEAFIKSIPLGRLGVADDIAKVAVFLASDLSDYITGTAIEVNGGVYLTP